MKQFLITLCLSVIVTFSMAQLPAKQEPKQAVTDTLIHFRPMTPTEFNKLIKGYQVPFVEIDNSDIPAVRRNPAKVAINEAIEVINKVFIPKQPAVDPKKGGKE